MPSSLTCLSEEELLAVAAGEEPTDELREHLAACPKCRELRDQFKSNLARIKHAVSQLALTPLTPSGLTSELVATNGQTDDPDGTANAARHAAESTEDRDSVSATDPVFTHEAGLSGEPFPAAIGKYLVIGQFRPTGQAEVYRVVHPGLAKELVLKLALRPIEPGGRHEIIEECRTLSEMEHPNLVRVFYQDFHDDRPYLVMEYIRGRTLEQVAEEGQLKPRQVAGLLAKVAAAADFAHRRGVFHRDIKPKNILVDERGEPRLIDFGMARLRHAWAEDPGKPGGTFAFMAPEQARIELPEEQQRVGARSDVFALGAVLYFLLTGKPPFEGRNWRESWDRARSCDFDRKSLEGPKVPGDLRRICLKAMAADPADRFASAAAFQKALEDYVRGPIVRVTIAGVAAVALLGVLGIQAMTWSPLKSSTVPPAPTTVTPLAGELTVRVWSKDGRKQGMKIDEPGAVPLLAGEQVHLEARLNQPAYPYLLWLDGKGRVSLLYPRDDGKFGSPPSDGSARDTVHSPEALDEGHRMTGPAGLETVLLLARRKPLPPGADVAGLIGHQPPPQPRSEIEVAVRGVDESEPTAELETQLRRSIDDDPARINEPLLRLLERLRTRHHFDVIKYVRFAYTGQ